MNRSLVQLLSLVIAIASIVTTSARAQYYQQPIGSMNKPTTLPYTSDEVGVDEKAVGNKLPLDAVFTDDAGKQVKLGDYFLQGRPVVLNIGYYSCPMLCGVMNEKMVEALKGVPYDVGTEYAVVNISIDPSETWQLARDKKKSYLKALGEPGNAVGWSLLTGSQESINAVTLATGYKYKKVGDEYAHAAVLVLVSPDGTVTHQLNALSLDSNTMKLALVEASGNRIGSLLDRFFAVCLERNPHTGKYTTLAVGVMQAGATVFVVGFLAVMVPLWIKSVKKSNTRVGPGESPSAGAPSPT
jgi:protein SCO1/2